ncbi:hypothetical protein BH09SUM1_BH09SUM1_28450 [soil metagenome]
MAATAGGGRWRSLLGQILPGVGALLCIAFALFCQDKRFAEFRKVAWRDQRYRQMLELPSGEIAHFIAIGYDNMYADWLWLNSIQAFGSGWITADNTTEPIFKYFDTMTDIDPHFPAMYRFGDLIIGDNRLDHAHGQELLRKGVYKNPSNYDIPYLGLYNAIWETNNLNDARWFSHRLERIAAAPSFMKRMQEYIERKDGNYEVAFEFNVRYFLQYSADKNDVEMGIVQRRIEDLLDRENRSRLTKAAIAYSKDHDGEFPARIEDIITPEYLPTYSVPLLPLFARAVANHENEIAALRRDEDPPESLVKAITEESITKIAGLPPEPRGTWYFFATPYREDFLKSDKKIPADTGLPYLRSGYDAINEMNAVPGNAQPVIMKYVDTHDGKRPGNSDLMNFLGRDSLGGHFVYQPIAEESPKYGVFYSTAGRRIDKGQEPRIGARGVGPFPLPLEPHLSDFAEDHEWGIKEGYIDAQGNERWESSSDPSLFVGPPAPKPDDAPAAEPSASPSN